MLTCQGLCGPTQEILEGHFCKPTRAGGEQQPLPCLPLATAARYDLGVQTTQGSWTRWGFRNAGMGWPLTPAQAW